MCVSFVYKWFGFQNLSRYSVLSLLLLKYGTCITAIVTIITTIILVKKKEAIILIEQLIYMFSITFKNN